MCSVFFAETSVEAVVQLPEFKAPPVEPAERTHLKYGQLCPAADKHSIMCCAMLCNAAPASCALLKISANSEPSTPKLVSKRKDALAVLQKHFCGQLVLELCRCRTSPTTHNLVWADGSQRSATSRDKLQNLARITWDSVSGFSVPFLRITFSRFIALKQQSQDLRE